MQVGGSHYKNLAIQPVEFIHANGIGYFEGNVIKYVTRWKKKNGMADLEKAKHYIELLMEQEKKRIAEADKLAREAAQAAQDRAAERMQAPLTAGWPWPFPERPDLHRPAFKLDAQGIAPIGGGVGGVGGTGRINFCSDGGVESF